MPGKKDMDLVMRILARGEQALKVLKRVRDRVGHVVKATARIGHVSRVAFGVMRRAASIAAAPLKLAAGVTLGLALTLGALSGKALMASGDIEALKLRMDGVTASAEQSNRVFGETMRLSVFSPYTPEELIDARIGLLNLGLMGKKAITLLGDAASITQKPLQDLVSIVAGMETEPLRRIGISLKRESGKFEFVYRDRMQRVKQITARGIDDARKALLSIFEVKYGGGMSRFAAAWKGLLSTLMGNIRLALARFGDGMMPAAKRFVDGVNAKLTKLIASGRLEKLGATIGKKVEDAFTFAQSVFEYGKLVLDSLKSSPEDMGAGMRIVMTSSARILATSFLEYLRGMYGVFAGMGKAMSAAFLESLMDLPHGIGEAISSSMLTAEVKAGRVSPVAALKAMGDHQKRKELLGGVANRRFAADINSAIASLPAAGQRAVDRAKAIAAEASGELAGLKPGQIPTFGEFRDQQRAAAYNTDRHLIGRYTGARRRRDTAGRLLAPEIRTFEGPEGKYGLGQQFSSGFKIIRIQNLQIRADGVRKMQNELLMRGAAPLLAGAGT